MPEPYVINQYIIIVGCLIIIFSTIGINIILIKDYVIGNRLKKLILEFSKGCTEEIIIDYINFLENNDIPPKQDCWNLIIATNKLIEIDDSIDRELKNKFKILILGKRIPI